MPDENPTEPLREFDVMEREALYLLTDPDRWPPIWSEMLATAEREAIEHDKGSEEMPFRIDADKDNIRAREIYEHWGFEYWRPFTSKSGREYAQLWRPPSEPEQDA